MRYNRDDLGFSFELPNGWRRDEKNLTISFHGPNGGLGIPSELIELQIGTILAQYSDPANREEFLREPGGRVYRTKVGDETNAVVLERASHTEISVVHHGVHYNFSHANDQATVQAIEHVKRSAQFGSAARAAETIKSWPDPIKQAVGRALRADSPESARRALAEAGARGARIEGGTFHSLHPQAREPDRRRRSWWQVWK